MVSQSSLNHNIHSPQILPSVIDEQPSISLSTAATQRYRNNGLAGHQFGVSIRQQ